VHRPSLSHLAGRSRLVAAGLAAALAAAGGLAFALGPDPGHDVRDGTTAVSARGLAARYGIDVKLLAVTAAGGLIDLRYQVVDPDKANPVVHDPGLFPRLIVERTGVTIGIRSLPHHHKTELQLGGTYYFLLANANNAIRKGERVTLVMGDARLEHLVAQA
jgi:hypothetical protein